MRAGSGQKEDQISVINAINKQPVRLDVAFPEVGIIAGQCMIHILWRKRFLPGKPIHNLFQKIKNMGADIPPELQRQREYLGY